MKRLFLVLVLLHYVLTWSALLYLNDKGWEHFDNGGEPGAVEQVAGGVFRALSFPVLPLLTRRPVSQLFPGLLGHIPFLLNSSLQAGVLVWVAGRLRPRARSPE